ncbi:hypothetical protein B0T10DRAFT_611646 [Thelonectria olida]|uniref:Uncharacterized protein n=1 Tax=Thelonectria olida TaxID=1576542 RepID=A0A9P8VPK3_9HYPO|nr:hypothetical protein B0T10DRAFT_611646 [Thelonectria olida]
MSNPQQPLLPQSNHTPAVYVSPPYIWVAKLTLRICSILTCIIIFCLTRFRVSWFFSLFDVIIFITGVAFFWSFAEAICLTVRQGRRGIHPSACVGIDLLTWIVYFGAGTTMLLSGCTIDFGDLSPDDRRKLYRNRALFACCVVQMFFHMGLFSIARYETFVRKYNSRIPFSQDGYGGTVTFND